MNREYFKEISKHEEISHSELDTVEIAMRLALISEPGTVIALYGMLGAGKSVFARAFASALGVEGYMPSPTFTIVQQYEICLDGCDFDALLFHMDLYRVHDSQAALAFGIDEYLDHEHSISLIEWPERIADILPEDTVHITLEHLGEFSRRIIIEKKK